MHRASRVAPILACSLLLAASAGWWSTAVRGQSDPVFGTWTLNVAKSTFTPGPPLKSGTVTFSPAGQGVHVVADLVDAQGTKAHTEYTGNYDGKDYPITGLPSVDTVTLKRLSSVSSERTDKKAGKVVQTYVRRVAADGKSMTVTQRGTDAKGQDFTNVMVFDRVP